MRQPGYEFDYPGTYEELLREPAMELVGDPPVQKPEPDQSKKRAPRKRKPKDDPGEGSAGSEGVSETKTADA